LDLAFIWQSLAEIYLNLLQFISLLALQSLQQSLISIDLVQGHMQQSHHLQGPLVHRQVPALHLPMR
jgi:hypothetical protein